MNYLAHFYLSGKDEGLILGNFIADFIQNREVASFEPSIQKGIRLHRLIDTYTDNHPMIRQGTKRLHPFHHKYAPVIIDVYYDYLLGHNWLLYSHESTQDFANQIYRILESNFDALPVVLQKRLPFMIEHNWLLGYTTQAGLAFVFERMQKRMNFPVNLDTAVGILLEHFDSFDAEFKVFFQDIMDYVVVKRQNLMGY